MRLVRWIFVVPGAIVFGVFGSFLGGLVATLFGQTAMDTASAFFGPFAFVFGATAIAPSHRFKVTLSTASVAAILAAGGFVLSMFATEQALSGFSPAQWLLTPLAQFLGAFYAIFIVPSVVMGTRLADCWRAFELVGVIVAVVGVLVAIIGGTVGLFGHGWMGAAVGLGLTGLGAVTWLLPSIHLRFLFGSAPKAPVVMSCGPEIGREIGWGDIVRQVFHVRQFDRAGTVIRPNGEVLARTRFKPYGYLLVESPIFDKPASTTTLKVLKKA